MSLGKLMVLQKSIAAAIRAQLSVPWLPTNCRLPLDGETQVIFYNCILMSQTAHLIFFIFILYQPALSSAVTAAL